MPQPFKPGDTAYIVSNGLQVDEVTVLRVTADSCVIRLPTGGAIRLRHSRIYPDLESAQAALPKKIASNHWEMEKEQQWKK